MNWAHGGEASTLVNASRVQAAKARLTARMTNHASRPELNLRMIIQIRDRIRPPTNPEHSNHA